MNPTITRRINTRCWRAQRNTWQNGPPGRRLPSPLPKCQSRRSSRSLRAALARTSHHPTPALFHSQECKTASFLFLDKKVYVLITLPKCRAEGIHYSYPLVKCNVCARWVILIVFANEGSPKTVIQRWHKPIFVLSNNDTKIFIT